MIAGARAALADAIRTGTGLDVVDHFAQLDHVGKPTVLVGVATGEPHPTGCAELASMAVWVVAAATDPGPADDELDAALDLVLACCGTWTTFERGTYGDTNPAYRITVEVPT